jgi:hypothetical protein
MGRLSGSHLLGATILGSALILAVWDRESESAPQQLPNSGSISGPEHEAYRPSEVSRQKPRYSYRTTLPPTRAVLSNLRRGTRIVVGSLDVSGARHMIVLSDSINDVGSADSLSVYHYSTRGIPQQKEKEKTVIDPWSRYEQHAENHCWESAFTIDWKGETRAEPQKYRLGTSLILATNMHCPLDQISTRSTRIPSDPSMHRIFLTPHFCDAVNAHEPAECDVILESTRIRVFLDRRVSESTDTQSLISAADRLISATESRALPIVESWIGPIHDVDRDQKLSIVITDLDQRTGQARQNSPIHGCIREADFQSDSSFGGDIVYLDTSILELKGDEQAALLTHELTHAAVCSLRSQTEWESKSLAIGPDRQSAIHKVPSWLNEAVAHFMELQCTTTAHQDSLPSENLQRRIYDFLANSARCPIVADERIMSLEERRSGSRAAATLFLAPLLSSAENIHRLLNSDDALDRRIEVLTSRHFADVFREWTVSLAETSSRTHSLRSDIISADFDHEQFTLPGTAFRCFECSDHVASIVIQSDASAQLQISIIEPINDTPATIATFTQASESR